MPPNLFIGREREQHLYQEFLEADYPWVWSIIGLGGAGKSTLLRYLSKHTPGDTCIAMLDFAMGSLRSDPLKVLDELARQVAQYCHTSSFETFKSTLKDGRRDLIQRLQVIQNISTGSDVSFHETKLIVDAADAVIEARRQVRELVTEAFYALIATFIPGQLVVMLDTCEWLTDPESSKISQWLLNELIPGIHTCLSQQHQRCFAVIASRLQPELKVISEQELLPYELLALSKDEVATYLEFLGVDDSLLNQHIYEMTHGHAGCIPIISDIIRELGNRKLIASDFSVIHEMFNERAFIKFVNKIILDERLKSPIRELTRYGVILRSFDLPLLQAVFPELLPQSEASKQFEQFICYPHVKSVKNHRYTLVALLRELLSDYIRAQEPDKWRSYHKRAIDYLATGSNLLPLVSDLSVWYYHVLAYDEERAFTCWEETFKEAYHGGVIEELMEAVKDKTLKLSHPLTVLQNQGMER